MKNILRRNMLPIIVFLTGACVLIVEVVAVRLLAPYFGNTVYAFSSVISVILAALSIGYYFGGQIADKFPTLTRFFFFIGMSGVTLLMLLGLSVVMLPAMDGLPLTTGPLIASCVFFFLPAVLMGTLSPYAVKLQKNFTPKAGIGTVAGRMFFWSTLGSIFGSLSAAFLLVPHFGVHNTMVGSGLFLVLLGFVPLLIVGVSRKRQMQLGAIVLIALSFVFAAQPSTKGLLYSKDGVYEKVVVFDGTYEGQPARFLKQDRNSSSAMYLHSDDLVYDYTKYYAAHELFVEDLQSALVIGGGIFSVPKELLRTDSDVQVHVAEIEPELYQVAQDYFRLTPSPRLHVAAEDGRRMLAQNDRTYDLIFGDAYQSLYSIPAHLTTQEFFELTKSRLSPNGIFMANIIGNLTSEGPSLLMSEMRTFQAAFPNSYFFAVDDPQSDVIQNVMMVGVNGDKKPDFASQKVTNHPNAVIKQLASKQIVRSPAQLQAFPLLTDDYAPVEYLTAQMARTL